MSSILSYPPAEVCVVRITDHGTGYVWFRGPLLRPSAERVAAENTRPATKLATATTAEVLVAGGLNFEPAGAE